MTEIFFYTLATSVQTTVCFFTVPAQKETNEPKRTQVIEPRIVCNLKVRSLTVQDTKKKRRGTEGNSLTIPDHSRWKEGMDKELSAYWCVF